MAGVGAMFAVLGPLQVAVDGVPVRVRGRRERAVLAVLLAARGEAVSAERLVDEVWGVDAAASATASLQVAISRLRTLLEPGRSPREAATVLISAGAGYALRVGAGQVDAERMVDLVEQAHAAVAADPHAAAVLCEQAERLWRGQAYADGGDGDLVRAERLRLDDVRLHCRELRAEALLAAGRHALVTGDLEALVAAHPFRERLWELYALALYRSGRQADALAALTAARQRLADELGVDPSPSLQRLQQDILSHDVTTVAAPAATISPPAPTPYRHALIGRDSEFAQLRALVAEAAAGATVFGLVEGEPGIGKSRLLEELAIAARASAANVVWGRCSNADVAPAFWPWREVVRGLVALAPDAVPEDVAALTDPGGLAASEPTQERRFRLFDGVARALTTVGAIAPLVVLLEDVHWADEASADLLRHLVHASYEGRVAVVASTREMALGRDDAVADVVAALARRPGGRRITLGAVTPAASPALVAQVAERPVPAEVAAAIHRRADGNPFCMAELTRLLAANDVLDTVAAVDRADVPAGVRDVVGQRLSALPPDTRSVLEVAAVIGREFDLPALLAATALDVETCAARLEPALVSRVVTPVPEVPGRHRFAHALVTEAVLAELSSLRSARLHANVAAALEATGGDLEVVAGHLWAAAPVVGVARAAEALERAAEVSVRRTAYEAAQDQLERALALRQSGGLAQGAAADEAELVTTLRLAGLRRARFGYSKAFRAIPLDRPREVALRSGRTDLYMGLLHLHWGALATSAQVEKATDLAEQMYELGRDSPDPVMRMLADQCMGVQNWHLGRLDRAGELMTLVDAAVRSLSPDDLTRLSMFDSPAFFTAFALHILELSGRSPEADDRFEQLYRAYTTPYEIVVVVNFAAFSAVCAGDAERALKWARRGIAQDNGRDFGMFGATAQMYGGWALAVLQDPDEGLALLERGLERFRAADAKTAWGALVLGHVEALLAAERPVDQVRDILQVEAAEAEATREPLALPYVDLARAQVAAASGAPAAEVASLLTRAIDAARKGGNALLLERASRLASQLGVEPSAATVIGRQRSTAARHVPNEAALQP